MKCDKIDIANEEKYAKINFLFPKICPYLELFYICSRFSNLKKQYFMKKTFLFLLALGMFAVSCKKEDKTTPEKPKPTTEDLTYISNTFKSIKIIHDNLKADAAQTPAQLLEMYKKDIKPNVAANTTADFEAWLNW